MAKTIGQQTELELGSAFTPFNKMQLTDDQINRYFSKMVDSCGLVIILIGIAAFTGWLIGLSEWTRVTSGYIPMAMDTALTFIVYGVLLRTLQYSSNRLGEHVKVTLAGLIAVYGLLKALEFLLGVELTFASTLFPAHEYLGRHLTNRMSPLTGGLFFISGIAAIAAHSDCRYTSARKIVGWLGAFVFSVGFLLVYGYILNQPFLYQANLRPISVPGSVAFSFLGLGLLAHAGPDSLLGPLFETSTKSRILRLFLPLIVLTCFAQQLLFQISAATDLNRALIILLVPFAASVVAIFAAQKLAQHLADQLGNANILLEESEEKHRAVVEHSHDMYWTLDMNGTFVNANKRCSEITGYDVSEWIGKSYLGILDPDDFPQIRGILATVLSGDPQDFEIKARHKNGSYVFLEVTSVPEYKSGKIVGVASFGRNITERKQSELELRTKEAMLSASQTIARIGSYDLDLKTMEWTNSAMLDELWGIDASFRRTPEGWLTLIHPDWQKQMGRYFMEEVLAKHKRFDMEYKIVRKSDGQELWVHGLGDITFDKQGNPSRMIGTIQDITERKKLEAERETLEAQLRQAQKMETIGTLAGGVAHDFNNILTPILVYSDMAAQELGEHHPQRQDLEQVIAGANRAKELVKQILTFSRQMEHERTPTYLSLIVKEAVKLLKASLPSSISIETHIQTENVEVLADPSQIHQVVMNLCTNAYQAMRETGGTLKVSLDTVSISAEAAKSMPPLHAGVYVRLSVADTGSGIDDSIRDRIFEPFFTTKIVGEGTGLGLSVVHGIVKSHDGAILLHSEQNTGTVFEVYLPGISAQHSVQSIHDDATVGGNEHILVVDDQAEVGRALKDVLEKRYGYKVTTCLNGSEALDLVRARSAGFDLLIVDQTMPGLSGVQLAQEVKSLHPKLPIVLMTGYSDMIDEEQCRELGIAEMMMKPPATAELSRMVRRAIDRTKTKSHKKA